MYLKDTDVLELTEAIEVALPVPEPCVVCGRECEDPILPHRTKAEAAARVLLKRFARSVRSGQPDEPGVHYKCDYRGCDKCDDVAINHVLFEGVKDEDYTRETGQPTYAWTGNICKPCLDMVFAWVEKDGGTISREVVVRKEATRCGSSPSTPG